MGAPGGAPERREDPLCQTLPRNARTCGAARRRPELRPVWFLQGARGWWRRVTSKRALIAAPPKPLLREGPVLPPNDHRSARTARRGRAEAPASPSSRPLLGQRRSALVSRRAPPQDAPGPLTPRPARLPLLRCTVQLFDQCRWGAGRGQQAPPHRHLKIWESGFGHGRQLGCTSKALRG